VSLLNKMVRYHFKDRYQSATEVLQALQPLAELYLPTQQAAPQPSLTDRLPPAQKLGQDNMHNSAIPPTLHTQMILLSKQICFADWHSSRSGFSFSANGCKLLFSATTCTSF